MSGFHLSYKWLSFTRPQGPPHPVPEGLERHWIDTPDGSLEILSATPTKPIAGPPVFFCHGGMGSAWVWTEYMRYLAAHGVPSYAISLRGHGDSWHPSFLRMTLATSRRMLGDDLVAGIEWVQAREDSKVLLVGHSSGGGLSQSILSEGRVDVKALTLLGAVPAYGPMSIYWNWWKLDPFFHIRLIFHAFHCNSPLSHPLLTQRVFFGDKFPLSAVIPFQLRMNRYESFIWPLSMMRPFASASSVLQHIDTQAPRVLIMAGTQDKLMTPKITLETTAFYRDGVVAAGTSSDDAGRVVQMELVEGAGHHLQNDVQWEDGASKLLSFYKAVSGQQGRE